MVNLGNDWDDLLKDEFKKDYYLQLREFLKEEYKTRTIYPNIYNIIQSNVYFSFTNLFILSKSFSVNS